MNCMKFELHEKHKNINLKKSIKTFEALPSARNAILKLVEVQDGLMIPFSI